MALRNVRVNSLFKNIVQQNSKIINQRYLQQRVQVNQTDDNIINDVTKLKQTNKIPLPDFSNHADAFRSKSLLELFRAYVIFQLCSVEWLVKHQLKIFKLSKKVAGKWLFRSVMKKTIYGQFLGGETKPEVMKQVTKNAKLGIIPMITYTAAEEHGEANELEHDTEGMKKFFHDNVKAIEHSIEMAAEMKSLSESRPLISTKITFIKPAVLLKEASKLIVLNKNLIENYQKLQDQSVEAKEFMLMTEECLHNIPMVKSLHGGLMNLQFHLAFKEEAKKHFKVYAEQEQAIHLNESEVVELSDTVKSIGQKAEQAGVCILIDTEQTYINPVITVVALDAMRLCNSNYAAVHNTYQCYLKETFNDVRRDLSIAKEEGFCWGGKIVRGGYIEEERFLAEKFGYEDPVNCTYDATTEMYHRVLSHLLDEIQVRPRGQLEFTVATHNADTVRYAINSLNEKGVSPGRELRFAQLRGMRDYVSYTLGQCQIPVAKLVHYGPVEDCVAYISRRVKENKGTVLTADYERKLLGKELKRRLLRLNRP